MSLPRIDLGMSGADQVREARESTIEKSTNGSVVVDTSIVRHPHKRPEHVAAVGKRVAIHRVESAARGYQV